MSADPSAIVTAARQRRELTRAKAIQALRELDRAGTPITFQVVAHAAAVSRSWLYAQPDIRAEIQRLRAAIRPAPTPPIPAAQRATADSLRQRLETTHERIRQLTDENQRLRRQLATRSGNDAKPSHPARRANRGTDASTRVTLRPRSDRATRRSEGPRIFRIGNPLSFYLGREGVNVETASVVYS